MAISQSLEMMGDWSFITLKMVRWWVQNPMIQSGENLDTWIPGYLVTWLPGYLAAWLPGYPVTRVMRTWLPGYLDAGWLDDWLPGYPMI